MILSILIPTIVGREQSFTALVQSLCGNAKEAYKLIEEPRIVIDGNVEIYYLKDNKELSIGIKRQQLIEKAKGEYVVFIDDDDLVSDQYINKMLSTLKEFYSNGGLKPDSIGFKIECVIDGKGPFMASASNKWDDWAENKGGFKYVRTPYQKTPIKREIALQIGYKDMRYGEDYDYSKRLKESGLIKSEAFIDEVMYYYNFKYEDPKTKYGFKD